MYVGQMSVSQMSVSNCLSAKLFSKKRRGTKKCGTSVFGKNTGADYIKHFLLSVMFRQNKLERLSTGKLLKIWIGKNAQSSAKLLWSTRFTCKVRQSQKCLLVTNALAYLART